ncbi:galactoside 2-alpha-L-fucosyltransferase-like [Selaginella moellendorffii]|uniref:galactoside 2-alpha-L-fucosyltransferase-like n=1 Tax=Selaginella moellendorffii TaxID=88036 RepID=UPI000D1C4FB3|nr:galactoside 2-alpha-L-fucosyltransferase-like [Selaginella moellendorffii]|eukprot:XP_024522837.1 galactoside 2-alpha-L-fucosyltransferase-like [Selaginella moellendorffii]
MKDINRVLDLGSSKLTVLLSLSGFMILVLLVIEDVDILHWRALWVWKAMPSEQTRISAGSIDPSCVSRSSQHLYRANKVADISPTLLESWKRYGELHRKCAPSNWTEVLLEESSHVNSSCKFMIYVETHEGLGNRILSLLSALLYSMITDRVLMIDSRKEVGKILCEPFQGSSWLLPADFPYEIVKHAPDLGQAIDKNFSVPIVHLHLAHVQRETDKLFFCNEFQEPLSHVRTLAWSSNQYFVSSFFKVPWMWRKLVTLFPGSRLDIFAQLSSLAIAPANSIWSLVSRFYNSYLSCSKSRVGVQIRTHSRPDLASFDPLVNQIVSRCLTSHHLLPNLSSSSSPSLIEFEKQQQQQHQVDVSVFVASLQGKYYETLRDEFLQNGTASEELVSFHSLSSEGAEWHNLHQASLALAEMWLLSFAHHLATSEFSTFGYISRGLARTRPWMLKIRGTELHPEGDVCYLSQSSEPCTHFPQQPDCSSARNISTEHREWIKRHLGGCQDQKGGLQLLNL